MPEVLRRSLRPAVAGQPGQDIVEAPLACETVQPVGAGRTVFALSSRPPSTSSPQSPEVSARKHMRGNACRPTISSGERVRPQSKRGGARFLLLRIHCVAQ